MATDLIIDRGRGPELAGTRITVYNLLPYFLDETVTEQFICQVCELSAVQVAAARAYVVNHSDAVMAEHRRIEARFSAGNSRQLIERAERTHAAFQEFREQLLRRGTDSGQDRAHVPFTHTGGNGPDRSPTFQEWLHGRNGNSEGT